ncbi:hypothetical protein [Zooshikella ganghwensis]|uniref:hypothetical protein n=1 Tax=Zooshikella ganghwensis TaxID=202772 RepID=UPI0004268C7B
MSNFAAEKLIELDRQYVWHHLTPHSQSLGKDPMIMVKGEGLRVWDAKGKEYLDAVIWWGLDSECWLW